MLGRLFRGLVGGYGMSLLGLCVVAFAVADEPPADSATPAANPYGSRATSRREAQLKSGGGSEESERAVAAAIHWIARHQNPDGSWGCQKCVEQCKDESCKAHRQKAGADYAVAATAFGVLPFLAAGQSHEIKGPYQQVILKGLLWLTKNQDAKTGRLGIGSMYEHALGTMALCEAYGVSRDPRLKQPALNALHFIEDAQNFDTGGWHYVPNPPTVGDTSVYGWQIMALRSGQFAELPVNKDTILRSKLFLKSVSKGKSGGLVSYMPESGPTPPMTAVGLLCRQHGGFAADAPEMTEGLNYLAANQNAALHNTYLLYYATQVMHNLPGQQWETWNRDIQKTLIESQIREGCAAGSWKPNSHDAGPLMSTSLTALTLEVYYRWNPLYEAAPKNP
jgi:hypothetical protein